ncbi:MAG: glycosyltransferase [Lachnospiraceae bacterium]|nr:glycosyltransferase [Lachnospiraceae bacterium]
MNKTINKLYYSFKCLLTCRGGAYVWIEISKKIFGDKYSQKFLYRKNSKMNPDRYENEIAKIYYFKTGKKLNLANPSTFNEKIQWMKLNDSTPLKTTLADKYLARNWVKDKIGDQYLIPLLGVWDKFDDINIDELPEAFVLKANHGCGWNVIVKEKEKADWNKIKENFDYWMSLNFAFSSMGFQMHYRDIPPKIIAEKYIESEDGNLYDYKIHCFNGKPEYIHLIGDRKYNTHQAKEAFYNTKWELQSFTSGVYSRYETGIERPENLDEMLRIAEVLSQGLIYVRVDLYELDNGEIKFGEMTFTPGSGFYQWMPPGTDIMWGEKIKLSGV